MVSSSDNQRPDVQAILRLLTEENAEYRQHLPGGYRLDLTGADLSGADLRGADLTGADLTGAEYLQQEQLDSACIQKDGKLPKLRGGLNPPHKVCVPRNR